MPAIPPISALRPSRATTRPPLPEIRVPAARAIVDCGVYVDGHRLRGKFTHSAALAEVRERGCGVVGVACTLQKPTR